MKTVLLIASLPLSYALIPVSLHQPVEKTLKTFGKRSNAKPIEILNGLANYQLEFQLGTPPQSFSATMDTGSSGFIIPGAMQKSGITDHGFYHTNSSTFRKGGLEFTVNRAEGDIAGGFYGHDRLSLGGFLLDDFEVAIVTNGTCEYSILGLGFGDTKMATSKGKIEDLHSGLLWRLKKSGAITYAAFSLWLNSIGERDGKLVFGGLDRSKISGDMYIFPVVGRSGDSTLHYELKMHEIYYINAQSIHQLIAKTEMSVILDSSAGITRMPLQLIAPFYQKIGATLSSDGTYTVDCQTMTNGGGIGFVLSGVEYVFEFHDIVIPDDLEYNRCIPGILPGRIPVLGSNFMRSLYVVYDMEKREIGIAAAITDLSHTNTVPHYETLYTGIPGIQAPLYNDTSVGTAYTVYLDNDFPSLAHIAYATIGSLTKTGIRVPHHFGGGVLHPGAKFDIDSRLNK